MPFRLHRTGMPRRRTHRQDDPVEGTNGESADVLNEEQTPDVENSIILGHKDDDPSSSEKPLSDLTLAMIYGSTFAMALSEPGLSSGTADLAEEERDRLAESVKTFAPIVFTPADEDFEELTTGTCGPASPADATGATDVRIASGNLQEEEPPVVENLRWLLMPRRPALLALTFSQEMSRNRVENLRNFSLLDSNDRPIPIAAALYGLAPRTLLLFPGRRLNRRNLYRLRVNGSSARGVANVQGRLLDGQRLGRAGTDFATILSTGNLLRPVFDPAHAPLPVSERRSRLASRPVPRSSATVQRPITRPTPLAVDAALDSIDLVGKGHSRTAPSVDLPSPRDTSRR